MRALKPFLEDYPWRTKLIMLVVLVVVTGICKFINLAQPEKVRN